MKKHETFTDFNALIDFMNKFRESCLVLGIKVSGDSMVHPEMTFSSRWPWDKNHVRAYQHWLLGLAQEFADKVPEIDYFQARKHWVARQTLDNGAIVGKRCPSRLHAIMTAIEWWARVNAKPVSGGNDNGS